MSMITDPAVKIMDMTKVTITNTITTTAPADMIIATNTTTTIAPADMITITNTTIATDLEAAVTTTTMKNRKMKGLVTEKRKAAEKPVNSI